MNHLELKTLRVMVGIVCRDYGVETPKLRVLGKSVDDIIAMARITEQGWDDLLVALSAKRKCMKEITIADILTDSEIDQARKLYGELKDTNTFASRVEDELIRPNIERINKKLGQENDTKYLAYCVEYFFIIGTKND